MNQTVYATHHPLITPCVLQLPASTTGEEINIHNQQAVTPDYVHLLKHPLLPQVMQLHTFS